MDVDKSPNTVTTRLLWSICLPKPGHHLLAGFCSDCLRNSCLPTQVWTKIGGFAQNNIGRRCWGRLGARHCCHTMSYSVLQLPSIIPTEFYLIPSPNNANRGERIRVRWGMSILTFMARSCEGFTKPNHYALCRLE